MTNRSDSRCAVVRFCYHSYDYRLNRTPLGLITIANNDNNNYTNRIDKNYNNNNYDLALNLCDSVCITKSDNFLTKRDSCYKVRRLFQSETEQGSTTVKA